MKIEAPFRGCLVVVLLFVGLLALFFVPLDLGKKNASPFQVNSDDAAIRFFQDHANDFERLRELIEKHPELVCYNGVSSHYALEHPENDLLQVRRLMSGLGVSAINGLASDWGIRLIFQSEGWVMASTTKSFYFSRKAPAPLVPSIQNYVITEPESAGVFRSIAENWYLKMDWDG